VIPPAGGIITDSGVYKLTGPVSPSFIANPQAHLNLADGAGAVLFDGDLFLLRLDQLATQAGSRTSFSPIPVGLFTLWIKQTV